VNIGQRVRSVTDGQVGFLVETEGGGIGVKLDRANEDRVLPYREGQWRADEAAPLNHIQIARIAYDADRTFRICRGEYKVTEWINLRDADRIAWSKLPKDVAKDPERLALYEAITGALAKK